MSPQPAKLSKPLTTLVEEQTVRETKPLLKMDEDDVSFYQAVNVVNT